MNNLRYQYRKNAKTNMPPLGKAIILPGCLTILLATWFVVGLNQAHAAKNGRTTSTRPSGLLIDAGNAHPHTVTPSYTYNGTKTGYGTFERHNEENHLTYRDMVAPGSDVRKMFLLGNQKITPNSRRVIAQVDPVGGEKVHLYHQYTAPKGSGRMDTLTRKRQSPPPIIKKAIGARDGWHAVYVNEHGVLVGVVHDTNDPNKYHEFPLNPTTGHIVLDLVKGDLADGGDLRIPADGELRVTIQNGRLAHVVVKSGKSAKAETKNSMPLAETPYPVDPSHALQSAAAGIHGSH